MFPRRLALLALAVLAALAAVGAAGTVVDFGQVPVGETKLQRVTLLLPHGTSLVDWSSPFPSFTLVNIKHFDGSVDLRVSFSPTEEGSYSDRISLWVAPPEDPELVEVLRVDLQGEGVRREAESGDYEGPGPDGGTVFSFSFATKIKGFLLPTVRDCVTGKPIPSQAITVDLVPAEGAEPPYGPEEIESFIISAAGYYPYVIEDFTTRSFKLSLGFLTLEAIYVTPYTEEICLEPVEERPEPRLILLGVGARRGSSSGGLTVAEAERAVYFQQQTVDELLRFRVEAPEGSVVVKLVARLHPLEVSRVYAAGAAAYVDLPLSWIPGMEEKRKRGLIEVEGWSWQLPVPCERFGTFELLEIPRRDRVRDTPVNQDTWFRVQEKELDKIRIRGGEAALGWWELEAEVLTPDGRIHRIRSVSGEKRTLRFRYRDGRVTTASVSFPQLYQIFSDDVPVYELASSGTLRLKVSPQRATEVSSYYAAATRNLASEGRIELEAGIDLTGISGEWTATMGGAYVLLGDPFSLGSLGDATLATPRFYVCPMVGDDDLPVEGKAKVKVVPPSSSYELAVTQDYRIGWAIGQELAKELVGLILGAAFPGGALQRGVQKVIPERLRRVDKLVEWLADKAKEKKLHDLLGLLAEAKKKTRKVAAYAAAYQGIFEEDALPRGVAVESKLVGGNAKAQGRFDKPFDIEFESWGTPSYRLISGASLSLFMLGPYDEILYHRVSARAFLIPDSSHWEIVDGNDRRSHDPNPNSTWR